jgi:superfamily II DNA or RNA helicase
MNMMGNSLTKGVQESIINTKLASGLADADSNKITYKTGTKGDLKEHLSKYLYQLLPNLFLDEKGRDLDELTSLERCNEIIDLIYSHNPEKKQANHIDRADLLLEFGGNSTPHPDTSLSKNSLLTGGGKGLTLVSQFNKELKSADSIDILCSFVKWQGIVAIKDALKEFSDKGKRIRVITTTYTAATDFKAVEYLSKLAACEVKISYNTTLTRLHAKAFLFYRKNGFSSAFIGSSNLSRPALSSGLEWNVKVSQYDSKEIWDKASIYFQGYWDDPDFQDCKTDQDREKLREALRKERGTRSNAITLIDVKPHAYQEAMLHRIHIERESHNRTSSLVVAATGTGKTMVAAFDYKAFSHGVKKINSKAKVRLLFIAHRKEILEQSWTSFRQVMRDQNFGQIHVGEHEADLDNPDHLFISVQSLNSKSLCEKLPRDHFDYIVVDEFHHAKAKSYQELLEYFKPFFLLGLTATPERMDGKDVTEYFQGYVSVEIRLDEAINRGLLCPFQYFGITDEVNYKDVKWSRGKYDHNDLSKLLTGHDLRVDLVLRKLDEYLLDPHQARGLGFCVTKAHAIFMADQFSSKGIPAAWLTSDSDDDERSQIISRLKAREINFIFSVDLFNEGVDIPFLDTVLFLRPTDSLTVFLQQLGRGLRVSDEKESLTVLDFIGQHRKEYKFGHRLKALVGRSLRNIATELEEDFPFLPSGCTIQMEKVAREYVLENIRRSIDSNQRNLVAAVRSFEAETGNKPTLQSFLGYHSITVHDFYAYKKRSWVELLQAAGISENQNLLNLDEVKSGLRKISQIDSYEYVDTALKWTSATVAQSQSTLNSPRERTLLTMFHFSMWGDKATGQTLQESIKKLQSSGDLFNEVLDVLNLIHQRLKLDEDPTKPTFDFPLELHKAYNRREILVALGHSNLDKTPPQREGVLYLSERKTDVFFVTFNKNELFHESVRYDDYAINEKLFHWQSQNQTSQKSLTGQRYINQRANGSRILLFAREHSKVNGASQNFIFFGPMNYISHDGENPISFNWELEHAMPKSILPNYQRATG